MSVITSFSFVTLEMEGQIESNALWNTLLSVHVLASAYRCICMLNLFHLYDAFQNFALMQTKRCNYKK